MKRLRLVFFVCSIWFLHSCTGGGGVETGNYLQVSIVDSQGNPAVGAIVKQYDLSRYEAQLKEQQLLPIFIDTVDSLGHIDLPIREVTQTMYYIRHAGEIAWMEDSKVTKNWSLSPVSLQSGIFTSTERPQWVFIPGTPLLAPVDSAGQFTLEIPLAQDKHSFWIGGLDSQRIHPAGYWDANAQQFVPTWEPERLLIARFDAETHIIEPQWIRSGSSIHGGAIWLKEYPPSLFFPEGVTDSLELALAPPDSSYKGRSMRLILAPDTNEQLRYLWIRFVFGFENSSFDWTCLDSLVFQYKGNAKMSLLIRNNEGNALTASFPTAIDWTRISIPLNTLHGSQESWTWDAFQSQLSSLIFSSEEPGEFWLDELEAIGCRHEDVFAD
jgi:hypothetical protein